MKKVFLFLSIFFSFGVKAQINYADIVVCKNVNGFEQRVQLRGIIISELINKFGQPTTTEISEHESEGGSFTIYKYGKTNFNSGTGNSVQVFCSFEIKSPEYYLYLSNLGIKVYLGQQMSLLSAYFPVQYGAAQTNQMGIKSFSVSIANSDNALVFSADIRTGVITSIEIYEPL